MHKTVIKMHTKKGDHYQFTYTGHMRYSPNKSERSGYGSDSWYYLCEQSEKMYILHFEVNGTYDFGCWDCTPLNTGEEKELKSADVEQWIKWLYTKRKERIAFLYLDNVDSIRHVLPKSARIGELNDYHYCGFLF